MHNSFAIPVCKSNGMTKLKYLQGAATGWFLTACANEFLLCGYEVKLLVPITAFLLLSPRYPNVSALKRSKQNQPKVVKHTKLKSH